MGHANRGGTANDCDPEFDIACVLIDSRIPTRAIHDDCGVCACVRLKAKEAPIPCRLIFEYELHNDVAP